MAQSQQTRCQYCGITDSGDHQNPDPKMTCYCSLEDVIDVLSKRHALQIIGQLSTSGPQRYSTLRDAVDSTSDTTFSTTLQGLVDADLLDRTQYNEIPPRVEYSLTTQGRALETHLEYLRAWHDEYE